MNKSLPPPPPPLSTLPVSKYHRSRKEPPRNDTKDQKWIQQCRNLEESSEKCNGELLYIYTVNNPVKPVIQDGPTCGLVALCMAGNVMGYSITMEHIVKCAQSNKYTIQGEMFSVTQMLDLAQTLFNCNGSIAEGDEKMCVLQNLLEGFPVLMPYDSDHNHEPCQRKGQKAHWAVLTGFAVKSSMLLHSPDDKQINTDSKVSSLYIAERGCSAVSKHFNSLPPEDVLVFAQQGKSSRSHLWSLDLLLQSNAQLQELSPKIRDNLSEYKIPDGGISRGLRKKFILLYT